MSKLQKCVVVNSKGDLQDVTNCIIVKDYFEKNRLPTIDSLLDWRGQLKKLQKENKYPKEWYDSEIAGTDFLLTKHNQKQ